MSFVKITASVPVYRVRPFIVGCLDSLAAQTRPPDEILVVNDGSDDGSAELAEAWCKASPIPARMVSHKGNQGLAQARNTALHEAAHDWIASVDTDALARPDWLFHLEEALRRDPGLSGLGGRLIEANRSETADAWRALHLAQHWGEAPVDNPPFLYGSGTLYHRGHLLEAGGYDAGLRTNFEDVDIAAKLYAQKRRLRYIPQALAFHQRKDSPQSVLDTVWRWIKPNGERAGAYADLARYAGYPPFLIKQAQRHLLMDRQAGSAWPVLRLSLSLLPYALIRDQARLAETGALGLEAAKQRSLGLATLAAAVWKRLDRNDAPGPDFWPDLDAAAPRLEGGLDAAFFDRLCAALPKGDPDLWLAFLNGWSDCLQAAFGKAGVRPAAPGAGAVAPGRQETPSMTVLIPTWRRPDKLKACLQSLADQEIPAAAKGRSEVLVVADGLEDPAEDVVRSMAPLFRARGVFSGLRYVARPHAGPAAARNAGIREAGGRVVAFIGDDIVCSRTWLREHQDWHRDHPADHLALLGLTELHPDIPETLVLNHLYRVGGQQFLYNKLAHGGTAGPGFFYTCNLSLKRAFLLSQGLFDESFPHAMLEDIELGLRLARKGLEIRYSQDASVWHDHPMDLAQALDRQRKVGRSMVTFCRLHPDHLEQVRRQAEGADEADYARVRAAAEQLCAVPVEALKGLQAGGQDAAGAHAALGHALLQRALDLAQSLGVREAMADERILAAS